MNEAGVLIVGGGFLGRALALKLAGLDLRVTVLSPHAGEASWPAGITAVNGRQEDRALVASLMDSHETVIHAAWGTTPGSSAERPALEAEKGLNPFLAFLETLQRFPETRLLFLSSGGTVYGDPERLPVPEYAPLRPRSCHGVGKAAAELFLGLLAADRTVILRPSNIYGTGQPLRSGFGVIPQLLMCTAEDRPFQLWGDGAQVRDYLYLDDFSEAVYRLVKHPTAAGTFNLGSGTGTSLIALIGLVEKATGRTICIEQQPRRDGDVERIVLDTGRIRSEVEWAPVIGLDEGIARAWNETVR